MRRVGCRPPKRSTFDVTPSSVRADAATFRKGTTAVPRCAAGSCRRGAISLAIVDHRVEVWSAGASKGMMAGSLSQQHLLVQRNPIIIADVFQRIGLIEKWGRGTNRVVAMCREAGIAPPIFEEIRGAAVVTLPVRVGSTA